MKLFYTNYGTITEERYLELKESGVAVESSGIANYHSGNIKEALAECHEGPGMSGDENVAMMEEDGMMEGGASTRRAIDDEAIEASMNDFGDLEADEDEYSPGKGSLNDLGIDDTADDIRGHEWFMDDDDDDEELLGNQEEEDEEYSPGFLPFDLDEELQHSQTANIDMMSPVVKEAGVREVAPPGKEDVVKALKKKYGAKSSRPYQIAWSQYNREKRKPSLRESMSDETPDERVFLLRKLRLASRAIMDDTSQLLDTLVAQGLEPSKAMQKIRATENIIDNIAQGLQMDKDVNKAKKRAKMAMSKNPFVSRFIPYDLGGEFLD